MLDSPHQTFDLPDLAADSIAEAGLMMMGVDERRLLAMLGAAKLTGEPGSMLLLIDHAWHQGALHIPFDKALADGKELWAMHRPLLVAADDGRPRSGAPREAWAVAYSTAVRALGEHIAPTVLACLAAAWFRREAIDQVADEH
jgi:hypothetical protein